MEVKKLENGNLAVRWANENEFTEIKDPVIAQYIIYLMSQTKEEFQRKQLSRLE